MFPLSADNISTYRQNHFAFSDTFILVLYFLRTEHVKFIYGPLCSGLVFCRWRDFFCMRVLLQSRETTVGWPHWMHFEVWTAQGVLQPLFLLKPLQYGQSYSGWTESDHNQLSHYHLLFNVLVWATIILEWNYKKNLIPDEKSSQIFSHIWEYTSPNFYLNLHFHSRPLFTVHLCLVIVFLSFCHTQHTSSYINKGSYIEQNKEGFN